MNQNLVTGTYLDQFCTVSIDEKSYKLHFIGLKNKAISKPVFAERQSKLNQLFSTEENCKLIEELAEN
jgi:hypothetical protein